MGHAFGELGLERAFWREACHEGRTVGFPVLRAFEARDDDMAGRDPVAEGVHSNACFALRGLGAARSARGDQGGAVGWRCEVSTVIVAAELHGCPLRSCRACSTGIAAAGAPSAETL